ncbi:mCG147854 [Mus musculus]|nr:mCG147854 [Mus musculus]
MYRNSVTRLAWNSRDLSASNTGIKGVLNHRSASHSLSRELYDCNGGQG